MKRYILFPVRFGFDATLTISVLGFVGGLLIALVGWRWNWAPARQVSSFKAI